MRRVVGSVLAANARVGVPDLVVVAYHHLERGTTIKEPRPTDRYLEEIATRLGSASTDTQGVFEIPLDLFDGDDETFDSRQSRTGSKATPLNLMVAVFISDDATALAGAEHRALARSSVRPNLTSEQEAFVLFVDDAHLLKRSAPSTGLDEQVAEAYAHRNALGERLASLHGDTREAALKRIADARDKVKDLSAVPLEMRKSKAHFVVIGKQELAEKGSQLQKDVIRTGCAKFKKNSTAPRRMRLVLSKDEVIELGLKIKKGQLSGTVKPGSLSGVIHKAIGGASLTRQGRVDLNQLARLQRLVTLPGPSAPATTPPSSPGTASISKETAAPADIRSYGGSQDGQRLEPPAIDESYE